MQIYLEPKRTAIYFFQSGIHRPKSVGPGPSLNISSVKSRISKSRNLAFRYFKTQESCNAANSNNESDWFTAISKCIPVEDEDQIFQIEGLKIYAISLSIRQRNDFEFHAIKMSQSYDAR